MDLLAVIILIEIAPFLVENFRGFNVNARLFTVLLTVELKFILNFNKLKINSIFVNIIKNISTRNISQLIK